MHKYVTVSVITFLVELLYHDQKFRLEVRTEELFLKPDAFPYVIVRVIRQKHTLVACSEYSMSRSAEAQTFVERAEQFN